MADFVERAILTVAPGWAASRAKAQREFLQHKTAAEHLRKYEAASTGRRNEGWIRPSTSANAEILTSASALRNGSRQLVRDNGHAANAVSVLEANVVGTGIRPDFEAESDATTRMLEELWQKHVENEISGADECGDFYSRQGLGFRAIVESGAVIQRRRRGAVMGRPLPYRVQLLEPDYLDCGRDGIYKGNMVVRGKEYNNRGDVIAYHLYKTHPGDSFLGMHSRLGSVRVPATDVSHAYRMDRPGQSDGVTWFAPVMTTLRDLGDTRDAYQLRQKIAACYTVIITESEPGIGTANAGQPIADHIEPGRIESIPPGKDVKFATPPGVDGMTDFDRAQLLTIAVGLGIPYEALTGDLRNVNFLSGRMGWLGFYRNIDSWRAKIVIPKLCKPEMQWFLESAAMSGSLTESVRVNWIAPHRDLLDPVKEIDALRKEMRMGGLSYPDFVKMRGRDPNVVIASIEKWKKELDDRDLFFDWDCEKFAGTGNMNTVQLTQEDS